MTPITSSFLPSRWHGGHLLLAALVLLALLLAGRAVMLLAFPGPPAPLPAPPPATDLSLLGRVDPFFSASDGADLPVTSLTLSLHGLRADSASGRGSAIIAGSDGVQASYAVGDSIAGATLVAVRADHVVLENGGVREALWLDAGEGVAEPAATVPVAQPAAPAQAGVPADAMVQPPAVIGDDTQKGQ
ncbi:type II secretion system protein N [Sandaracinobacteroides saxicola]|uniref:Type II secretion system protein GspC N-terminal domain-containing protein n=1 Tax=Sandaracinobacteroides saxicola TaxID=2759707 RepID=A0A7G5IEF4_9SPHN|nr:type II secretion system protein N [Sandaracinobacteroides saxicola]QMW21746.1 hypothetical protein H3309_10050 [Sandaracinobacteroides saxicola]